MLEFIGSLLIVAGLGIIFPAYIIPIGVGAIVIGIAIMVVGIHLERTKMD